LRGNCSMPIHFKGCHVPEIGRLGSPTCGFSMLFAYSLPIYQVGLSRVYLGIAQAAYQAAVDRVKKRVHSDTKQTLSQVETVQRLVRDARAGSVMAPSDDSLKLIVGRQILGIAQPWE